MKSIVHAKKNQQKKKGLIFAHLARVWKWGTQMLGLLLFVRLTLRVPRGALTSIFFSLFFLRNVPRHIVNLLHTLGTSPRCILILNFQISIQRKWWNSWGKTCNTTGSGCWHLRGCTSTSKSSIRKKYKASQSVLPISLATSWVKPSWET